jgi:hypothetical protein
MGRRQIVMVKQRILFLYGLQSFGCADLQP